MPASDLSTNPPHIGPAKCCGLCRHFSIESWSRGRCDLIGGQGVLFGWTCERFEVQTLRHRYSPYRRMIPPAAETLPYKAWSRQYRVARQLAKATIVSQIANARLESEGLPSTITAISLEQEDIINEKASALGIPHGRHTGSIYETSQAYYRIVSRYRDEARGTVARQLKEWRKEYIQQHPPPPKLVQLVRPEPPDPMRRFLAEEAEEQHDED